MSVRRQRLARIGEAFKTKGRMLEARMAALALEIRETDAAISGIGTAMESPIVHVLSLHLPAMNRIAELNRRSIALNARLVALRGEAIDARAKGRFAEKRATALVSEEFRKNSEHETLETVAVISASSLRQAVCD